MPEKIRIFELLLSSEIEVTLNVGNKNSIYAQLQFCSSVAAVHVKFFVR